MFKSYSLDLSTTPVDPSALSLASYKDWLADQKSLAHEAIDKYISDENTIDCKELENDWFPAIEADIFLSHSHVDEELGIAFAAALWDKFGLRTFIDSLVWGYAGDLQRKIHDEYCYNEYNDTYKYAPATQCTTHINLLLSGALTKMIDKTECLFFLNTDNSIASKMQDTTHSPWIYTEIEASRMLRISFPQRDMLLEKAGMEAYTDTRLASDQAPKFRYKIDRTHMRKLSFFDVWNWFRQDKKSTDALDYLYNNHK